MKKKNKKKTRKPKKTLNRPKKLWGLEVKTFPKYSQHHMDQDYISTLSDEEKAWLSKFNEEYYGNTIKKDAIHLKSIDKKDKRTKKYKKAKKVITKDIYSQTNSRARDIYYKSVKFSLGWSTLKDYNREDLEHYNSEEGMLEYLDKKIRFNKDTNKWEEIKYTLDVEKDVLKE